MAEQQPNPSLPSQISSGEGERSPVPESNTRGAVYEEEKKKKKNFVILDPGLSSQHKSVCSFAGGPSLARRAEQLGQEAVRANTSLIPGCCVEGRSFSWQDMTVSRDFQAAAKRAEAAKAEEAARKRKEEEEAEQEAKRKRPRAGPDEGEGAQGWNHNHKAL